MQSIPIDYSPVFATRSQLPSKQERAEGMVMVNPHYHRVIPDTDQHWVSNPVTAQETRYQPPSHAPEKVHQDLKPEINEKTAGHLLKALAFGAVALLTHRLPASKSSFKLLTSDWKAWARIGLGLAAVNQVNKAIDIKPPAWLGALEAIAVIGPLVSGLSKRTIQQMAVMAPVVVGVVSAANWLNKKTIEPLDEKVGIPPLVTRLAIMAGTILLGLKAYPKLFRFVAQKGLMGKAAKHDALHQSSRAMVGTEAVVCSRGCCHGSVICLSELGEFFAGMGHWFTGKHHHVPAESQKPSEVRA